MEFPVMTEGVVAEDAYQHFQAHMRNWRIKAHAQMQVPSGLNVSDHDVRQIASALIKCIDHIESNPETVATVAELRSQIVMLRANLEGADQDVEDARRQVARHVDRIAELERLLEVIGDTPDTTPHALGLEGQVVEGR